jgi:hypothetical protein
VVCGFFAHADEKQFEAIHRYFRTLGLLAKNDIFYQFEPTIVIEFISAFRDAMRAGGDWDVRQAAVAAAATAFLRRSRCSRVHFHRRGAVPACRFTPPRTRWRQGPSRWKM